MSKPNKKQGDPITVQMPPDLGKLPVDLPRLLLEIEKAYILAALKQTDDKRLPAAALLGLKRTALVEKIRRRIPSLYVSRDE